MALLTMAFLAGLGAMGAKGLWKQSKHDMMIRSHTTDPESYVKNLVGERYMEANSKEIKIGYLDWLDHNFVLTDAEMNHWSNRFDEYTNRLIKNRKNKSIKQYKNAKKEYQKIIQDPYRKPQRQRVYIYEHYFDNNLNTKMKQTLNKTFIGKEIDKSWVKKNKEEFLCINTKLKNGEIQKFYKICWNYTHNNDIDRM